jgi:DnaK suppressor protein
MNANRTSRRVRGQRGHDLHNRNQGLRQLLEHRRSQIQQRLEGRVNGIRAGRASGVTSGVLDLIEMSEVHGQEDLDYALAELDGEMLRRIDETLRRLEAGAYGTCVDCGEPIAASRLQALPFAVRCCSCEKTREAEHDREQTRLSHSGSRLPRRPVTGSRVIVTTPVR